MLNEPETEPEPEPGPKPAAVVNWAELAEAMRQLEAEGRGI